MKKIIQEGLAKAEIDEREKISKELDVFYNPVMKNNRDISVMILNSIPNKNMQIGLPMEASGIRGIRFIKEARKGKIKNVSFNDNSLDAVKAMKKNLKMNKIRKNIQVSCSDANLFLLNSKGFDYIDIDPFGSPNKFLDSAVKRISRNGILAVTATDTSNLAGTYKEAWIRKYWSVPIDNELRHEIGVRILIRKVQLVGAQYEKAMVPIFSYFKDHYYRIFFCCEKGKKKVDEVMRLHGYFKEAGPIWLGDLWDDKIADKISKCKDEVRPFLQRIALESKIKTVGFFDVHAECKRKHIKVNHKIDELMEKIRNKGFKAERTHFSDTGIRSDITITEFLKML